MLAEATQKLRVVIANDQWVRLRSDLIYGQVDMIAAMAQFQRPYSFCFWTFMDRDEGWVHELEKNKANIFPSTDLMLVQ